VRSIIRSLRKDWTLLHVGELSMRDRGALIVAKYRSLLLGTLRVPFRHSFRLRGRPYFFELPMEPAFFISVLLSVRDTLALLDLRGRDGLVLVDVGAHNGETSLAWTIFLERPTIYAFEPHPGCFANAARNLEGSSVQLQNVGLSDEAGSRPFDFQEMSAGTTTFVLPGQTASQPMMLPVVRGDDVLPSSVDLVKVDVEGFEFHVLGGMREVLRNARSLILELSIGRPKDHVFADMAGLLSELGFELLGTSEPHQAGPNGSARAIDLYLSRDER
jgi:FkbM family methyltransferase